MTEEITINEKSLQAVLKQYDDLEQENKELKAYKDVNEDFKKAWGELNEKYKQLRSALEEAREYLKDCYNDVNLVDKINECLGG